MLTLARKLAHAIVIGAVAPSPAAPRRTFGRTALSTFCSSTGVSSSSSSSDGCPSSSSEWSSDPCSSSSSSDSILETLLLFDLLGRSADAGAGRFLRMGRRVRRDM